MPKPQGKHPEKRLTDKHARNAKPGMHSDGNGLYLRVEPNGAKRWVQRITIKSKRRDLGLGGYPLFALADVRKIAAENRRIARMGGDPRQNKHSSRGVPTFETLARELHEVWSKDKSNDKHKAQFISTLETYIFPSFGETAVTDITSSDVRDALEKFQHEKPETARRVRQRVAKVFDRAVENKYRADNPVDILRRTKIKNHSGKRKQPAVPFSDIRDALARIQVSNAMLSLKLAAEFQLLTTARPGEVRLARWSEIRSDKALWIVPAERTKMKRQHTVPLSNRAIDILFQARQWHETDDDLLFPALDADGKSKRKPFSDGTLAKLMSENELNIASDQDGRCAVPHGFRATFKSWAMECAPDFNSEVAEFCLAHVESNAAKAAYQRTDMLDRRRQLLDRWCGFVLGA